MLNIQNYKRVESIEEAYELNQKKANRIVGGMMWMRMGDNRINTAIDMSGLGLDKIEEKEDEFMRQFCDERGCEFALSEVWAKGGEGGIDLAKKVLKTLEEKESNFKVLYPDNLSLKEKVETIAKEIYGADGVTYESAAEKMLAKLTDLGFGDLPVCMAKTQYSLSDDQTKLGRPEGFDIHVRDAFVNAGAGFVVILTGAVMTMPGLPKKPAAFGIDVDDNG